SLFAILEMMNNFIVRWDKQHECASIININLFFTKSARVSFFYWSAAEPAQRRLYLWYIIEAVITHHTSVDFFITD
ncbi:hypothetical protein KAU59_00860, partial [candidate division WOR-3 bacterium]|nr:hypothetical protein [candidate division WOR-3 bacterium]